MMGGGDNGITVVDLRNAMSASQSAPVNMPTMLDAISPTHNIRHDFEKKPEYIYRVPAEIAGWEDGRVLAKVELDKNKSSNLYCAMIIV